MYEGAAKYCLAACLMVASALVVPVAGAQIITRDQSFARRSGDTGGYFGISTYIEFTPDYSITSGANGAPAGLSNFDSDGVAYPLIESGPINECDNVGNGYGCGHLEPYSTFINSGGYGQIVFDPTSLLGDGWFYQYASYFIGNNTWRAQWCDGEPACYVLAEVDLGTSYGEVFAIDGGEATAPNHIGNGSAVWNQYLDGSSGGNWYAACYTSTYIRPTGGGGYVGNCDTSDYSWTFGY
jgi:hypothetical protein